MQQAGFEIYLKIITADNELSFVYIGEIDSIDKFEKIVHTENAEYFFLCKSHPLIIFENTILSVEQMQTENCKEMIFKCKISKYSSIIKARKNINIAFMELEQAMIKAKSEIEQYYKLICHC